MKCLKLIEAEYFKFFCLAKMFQRWNWYLLIDLNWFITNIYWLIKFGDGMSEGGEIWSLEWLCTATPTSTDVITASSSSSFFYLLTTDSRSDWVMFDLKVSRLSAWTQLFFLDIGADLTEGQILLTAGWFIFFLYFIFALKSFQVRISGPAWTMTERETWGDWLSGMLLLSLIVKLLGNTLLWCHFEYNTQTVIIITLYTSHSTNTSTTWHSTWLGS